jgi:hypothetical protein
MSAVGAAFRRRPWHEDEVSLLAALEKLLLDV